MEITKVKEGFLTCTRCLQEVSIRELENPRSLAQYQCYHRVKGRKSGREWYCQKDLRGEVSHQRTLEKGRGKEVSTKASENKLRKQTDTAPSSGQYQKALSRADVMITHGSIFCSRCNTSVKLSKLESSGYRCYRVMENRKSAERKVCNKDLTKEFSRLGHAPAENSTCSGWAIDVSLKTQEH